MIALEWICFGVVFSATMHCYGQVIPRILDDVEYIYKKTNFVSSFFVYMIFSERFVQMFFISWFAVGTYLVMSDTTVSSDFLDATQIVFWIAIFLSVVSFQTFHGGFRRLFYRAGSTLLVFLLLADIVTGFAYTVGLSTASTGDYYTRVFAITGYSLYGLYLLVRLVTYLVFSFWLRKEMSEFEAFASLTDIASQKISEKATSILANKESPDTATVTKKTKKIIKKTRNMDTVSEDPVQQL